MNPFSICAHRVGGRVFGFYLADCERGQMAAVPPVLQLPYDFSRRTTVQTASSGNSSICQLIAPTWKNISEIGAENNTSALVRLVFNSFL
jgi:hypothetical protein